MLAYSSWMGPGAPNSVLLCLTGLHIDGGIACVSRCMARALDELVGEGRIARTDRVLLLDDPRLDDPKLDDPRLDDPSDAAAPPRRGEQRLARGSQARFVWETWRLYRRERHDMVLFDLVGLARSIMLPIPPFPPPRHAIFVHGIELGAAGAGARAKALGSAECVLVNSEFTAAGLRELLPETGERIRVVPLCIDPDRVATWEAAPASSPPREPAVLIVGRMSPEERGKGHDHLIEAWPGVRRQLPAAELWVVGGGEDVPRIQARARDLGVGDAVRFLGRVTDDELRDLYQRASLFAMPSRQEGFGLVYAEAMWHGLACLGSTADAAGQVIRDGETGVLVPYADVAAIGAAVAGLLADPGRCRALGEAGARRARQVFSYPRFRADFLAALGFG